MDRSELEKFIRDARSSAGRDAYSPFSLEDIYSIAFNLGINGIIYLEKFDDKRHVNVLLDINEDNITLYDPLSSIKKKSYNKIQLGMYCKPIGSYKDDFQKYKEQFETPESTDIWDRYEQKGKLLFDFLIQHNEFRSFFTKCVSHIGNLSALQNNISSSDCAPISLFIISLGNTQNSKS